MGSAGKRPQTRKSRRATLTGGRQRHVRHRPRAESYRGAGRCHGRDTGDAGWAIAQQPGYRLHGRTYTANIATKSLRRAEATIAANGAENTFVMVQGRLQGSAIADCGLVAQVKVAKAAEGSQAPSSD